MNQSDQHVREVIHDLRMLKNDVPQDVALRRHLHVAIRELSLALETPLDTVRRIAFSVATILVQDLLAVLMLSRGQPLQITVAKIANDLGIFGFLSRHGSAMSTDELVLATKAEKEFLIRILRYLAAVGMIAESSRSEYSATNTTRTLSIPGFEAGINHHFDAQLPSWLTLPSFLASTAYMNPSDPSHTSFQLAHGTTLPAFQWAATRPHIMHDFALWMSTQRKGQKSWLDVFPLDAGEDDKAGQNTPLFVDVGGGMGHQCLALKSRHPSLKRRIILQDLPTVLAKAGPVEGIEHMPHDLWEEQPVHDASFYYLRNILHDYPDVGCVTLLKNIKPAMSCDSAILIDEIVLPDVDTQWQAAQLDISMMASLAGRERSETEWRKVVDAAGLKIEQILAYDEEMGDKVIVVML
nr:putative O-methyltransferase [Cladonia uncialis subsp. uncialis]